MGAWGTTLYANDTASDLKGDYVDQLKRGKTNEEVTKFLIDRYQEYMGNETEEPLFWFALADTQWNYGRLLPEVKEKALFFLGKDGDLELWREEGIKYEEAWEATREKLREKLNSPQPEEKKVSKYRLYRCEWKLGDVFAYRFISEESKEKGYYGKYVVFRKISEQTHWKGHILPLVQFFEWYGNDIPSLEEIKAMKVLNIEAISHYWLNQRPSYYCSLNSTSKRVIPKDNLILLGNMEGEDLCELDQLDYSPNCWSWETQGSMPHIESEMMLIFETLKSEGLYEAE